MGGRSAILGLVAAAVGCSGDFGGFPREPSDPPPGSPELTRIREDFNNRDLIALESGEVVVDVNRGIVTLDAQMFPSFSGGGIVNAYDRPTQQNGLIEAQSIVVHEGGTVEASDSVELRAEDRVIIAGALVVGRGGITIIAKRRIQIDGVINSEGPVRLLLGDDTGTIEVNGSINTISTFAKPSDVIIYGRGSVSIGGEIWTSGVRGTPGGQIEVYSYGDLSVSGPEARLYTLAEAGSIPGRISLQSELDVVIANAARIGISSYLDEEIFEPGGEIEVRATNVTIGDDVILGAGASASGEGKNVVVTAANRLLTAHRAQIAAGHGAAGGSVLFKAGTIEIGEGTRILGGSGSARPGLVHLQAVESMLLQPFASIEGGTGRCTAGGEVRLEVGGVLSLGEGAFVIGGSSTNDVSCGLGFPGGPITVFAREIIGGDGAFLGGRGVVEGPVLVNIVADYTVVAPNLSVGSGGEVESRTFDRGPEALGTIPRLVELVAATPEDTRITLMLAGADHPEGPFENWLPVTSDTSDRRFEVFGVQRFFRYRVILEGRKFDVPVLDYFEIDLDPRRY